jgi:REP element-mobilizing transposase RayT
MKHPAVSLNGAQARAIGRGFAEYVRRSGIAIWACSILPGHVHMVIARHSFEVESAVNQLKGYATRQLNDEKIRPSASGGSLWARGQWKVFLNDRRDIERAIRYVERNPLKERLPQQYWNMVTA